MSIGFPTMIGLIEPIRIVLTITNQFGANQIQVFIPHFYFAKYWLQNVPSAVELYGIW